MLANVIRTGTTRGLDFVTLSELQKRAGVNGNEIALWALSELLANALDKDATSIKAGVRRDENNDGFLAISVSDDGTSKLSINDLELILDFENKASSKRGILRVSRGMLGNALKTIFGFSYALNESEHPRIVVESQDNIFEISLRPDFVDEKIEHQIQTKERTDDGFTTVQVKLFAEAEPDHVRDFLDATTFVNPDRRFEFDVFGNVQTVEPGRKNLIKLRNETSVLWYTIEQFSELLKEFRKASPEARFREFLGLFRGFSGLDVMEAACKNAQNEKSQIMIAGAPACALSPGMKLRDVVDEMVEPMFNVMKSMSELVSDRSIPSVVGCVGKQSFKELALSRGWELRSCRWAAATKRVCKEKCHDEGDSCESHDHVEFPLFLELAVFYRPEDSEGLKVYPCLNFAASVEKELFESHYDISAHVARSGKGVESPITIVAHVVTPVVGWLNYGKTAMA